MSEKTTHVRKKPTSEAVQHWRWQRISAVVILFLSCWFMVAVVNHLQTADAVGVAEWLKDTKAALLLGVLVLAMLVHKHIGIHEILTDYVHKPTAKCACDLALNILTAALGIATLAAIWHLHYLGMHA